MLLRKMMPAVLLLAVIAGTSCNNSAKISGLQKQADSLFDVVMKGHDVGMPKMMRVEKMQVKATRTIDSIGKLPAAKQEVLKGYVLQLDTLLLDLSYATTAMDKWMSEMNFTDTLNDNLPERIKYLGNEEAKVKKMNEAITNSLAKADTLLKK
jgi:hypothetical protein